MRRGRGAPGLRRGRGHGHPRCGQSGRGGTAAARRLPRRPGPRGARALPADTQRVWGRGPWGKLVRAKDVPRNWARGWSWCTRRSAGSGSTPGTSRSAWPGCRTRPTWCSPWRTCSAPGAGRRDRAVRPVLEPGPDGLSHITLDLSHTAVSGSDALAMHDELGGRLAHVHLADGSGLPNRDEHLVPGRGTSRARRCCTGWPPRTIRG